MTLSIIVPVYNVESYLQKCIDSLLDQDLDAKAYEIILIDDGSLDTSGAICDENASLYENILVVHQQNKGLSGARNVGISKAQGKYIQFVDSDDYLVPKSLGGLIQRMETDQLDILRFNYQNVDNSGNPIEHNKMPKRYVDYSSEICDGRVFLNEKLGSACYAVQFIIRKELVQVEGNRFIEGIFFEDVEWTPKILLQAQRVSSSCDVVYNYLFRQESISRSVSLEKKEKSVNDKIYIIQHLLRLKNSVEGLDWFDGVIAHMTISILQDVGLYMYQKRHYFIRLLKRLYVFPLSLYHATDSGIRKIRIANISPYLLCAIMHCKRSSVY